MCNPFLECNPSGQKARQLISATASNCLGYASDSISLLRGLENPKGSVGLSLSQTDGVDSLDPFSGLAFPPSEVPPFIYCHIKKGMATVRGSARVSCPLSASSRRAGLVRSPLNVPFCSTDASMLNLICSILFSLVWLDVPCRTSSCWMRRCSGYEKPPRGFKRSMGVCAPSAAKATPVPSGSLFASRFKPNAGAGPAAAAPRAVSNRASSALPSAFCSSSRVLL